MPTVACVCLGIFLNSVHVTLVGQRKRLDTIVIVTWMITFGSLALAGMGGVTFLLSPTTLDFPGKFSALHLQYFRLLHFSRL